MTNDWYGLPDDMCGEEHPFYRFHCLRNRGHKGQHWFTMRWEDWETESDRIARLMEQMQGVGSAESGEDNEHGW